MFPDLMLMLVNIGPAIEALIMGVQGILLLIGLCLIGSAIFEYWICSTDSSQKFWPGRNRISVGSATITLLIGGLMLALGDLKLVGILTRTVTGSYVASRYMSYTPAASTHSEFAIAATLALFGILQLVGLVAMCKGFLAIHRMGNGQNNAGWGVASSWLIGGVLCWNMKWFSDALNSTIGFNVITYFFP